MSRDWILIIGVTMGLWNLVIFILYGIDNGTTVILDVRTEAEYNESHIEDAVLLPYDEIDQRAGAVLPDKNSLILIYCRSGRRSEIAARELVEMGYRKVYDFSGIIDWSYGME